MTDGGMRQRISPATRNQEHLSTTCATPSPSSENEYSKLPRKAHGSRRTPNWMLRILVLPHMLACLLYVAGWYWRMSFHTGEECEMTFSYPNFVPLTVAGKDSSKLSSHYKLYKFVDGRDPRYQNLLQSSQPLPPGTQRHCGATQGNATIVLYIPGHWGSHSQARSLGAHGTQWTQAREDTRAGTRALMTGEWSGAASRLDQFVYEVYSIDFAEQGGAWHGRFLEAQSDFVAQVVEQLATDCQVHQVFVVAHSMGGYVARLTIARYPHLQSLLENIVTLATPHANPLYAFDASVHGIHRQIIQTLDAQGEGQSLWVSLSGGLRDEMIAPIACEIKGGYSYLTTTLLASGSFGMDHRAIVWCHGVLKQVRQVIWALRQAKGMSLEERTETVQRLLGVRSYEKDMLDLKARLSSRFGPTKAFAMDCSMLYNLPVIFGLHAILAAFHHASVFCMPLVAVFFITSDVPLPTLLVLTLVASSIHFLLVMAMSRISSGSTEIRSSRTAWFGLAVAVICLVSLAVALVMSGWAVTDTIKALVYVSGIAIVYLLSCSCLTPPLVALIVLAAPGMLAGTIVLAGWEQSIEARSWWMWTRLVLPVLGVVRSIQSSSTSKSVSSLWNMPRKGISSSATLLRAASLVAAVLWTGRSILMRGHANQVGPMVEVFLIVDMLSMKLMARFDN